MKKYTFFIISILLCFITLFYLSFNIKLGQKILNPERKSSPLEGTWTAIKYFCLENCSLSDKDAAALLGNTIIFSDNSIHVSTTTCKSPNYKVKQVDSQAYLWDNYKLKASDIGINTSKIRVYSVSSFNSFFDDYIKIDDNHIARSFNGVLLIYNKSGSLTKSDDDTFLKPSKIILSKEQKDIISKTGLILGLRCQTDSGYSYKTLFISKEYNNYSKIIEVNNLIIPRKNGFWKMSIDDSTNNNFGETTILEYPLEKYSDTPLNLSKIQNVTLPANSFVNFISTDYVFIDNASAYFSVLPLDDINSSSIAFSKIFGLTANNYLKRSAKLFLTQKEKKNVPEPNLNNLDTNWGIIRRTGKWILRGRIPAGDFDVSFQIPKVLTTYDDLYIPFNIIRQKYPNAIDAYASINKDFLVVLSNTNLAVLPTTDNNIESPTITYNLPGNETVIMAEWATGDYVSAWHKLFLNFSK